MLRETCDKGPEPPRFKTILLWSAFGVVIGLMAVNVVREITGGDWNF